MHRLKATLGLISICIYSIATVQATSLEPSSETAAGIEAKSEQRNNAVIQKVDSLLILDEYAVWEQSRGQFQLNLTDSIPPGSLASAVLFLFEPFRHQIPRLTGLSDTEQAKANWTLIRHLRREQVYLDEQPEIPHITPVDVQHEQRAPIWWIIPAILLAISLLLWMRLRQSAAQASDQASYRNSNILHLVNHINGKDPQCDPALELALFEFNSNWSPVLALLDKHPDGKALSKNQKLILHLLWRNIKNDSIVSHFGITSGHFYNQRSAIRKLLKLDADGDIRSQIDRMLM